MRWPHHHLIDPPGYGPDAVAIISTPLYSNTTLVSFIPALAGGGMLVLMPQFAPRRFLELCQRHKVSFAMLVPDQYRRILDEADFDAFDLSSFHTKYATSAPFPAELKAEVLRRWPGGLIEYYGLTEGGGSCGLFAHERPDKLATMGQPLPGHEIRIIDDEGHEVPPGEVGELVGRSPAMMTGYHNQPAKTAEAEWHSPEGVRFIRSGDLGRFDGEGFLTLVGRKKDMIISGGANVYPLDLEAILAKHSAVREAAVVAAPSERWGETPVAFVVLHPRHWIREDVLLAWANQKLGKTQRISEIRLMPSLPRNAIGKILKRDLQAQL
jgi:acyl-CoA synthetase (AMP-forming)/AMP-acid ligase II